VVQELWRYHDNLAKIPEDMYTDDSIQADKIVCSVCQNTENDDLECNDTLLCDRLVGVPVSFFRCEGVVFMLCG
jgi:uncharacterized CHY-type Zn-finger protein